MPSYTSLFGLFALTSLLLSNCLIILARYARQIKMPPEDEDYERLINEKSALETQLAQDQRSLANLKSTLEQIEGELQGKKDEIEALKAKIPAT